ncbi:MAG: hypothetical protein N2506_05860 [Dehalococcoidales bacterium]|nr:hypothetical protein [Dehalococcoidales bacterium]
MSIEYFRDVVICIFGLSATAAFIIFVVLALLLYLRLKPVIDSMRTVSNTVAKVTSAVETELAGPLAQLISFVQGIRQAVSLTRRFFSGEEED